MPEPYRRSSLQHRSEIAADGVARIAERRHLDKFVLRGDAAAVDGPVRETLGLDLPIEACTASERNGVALLWIGPDEWWAVSERGDGGQAGAAAQLGEALAGIHHQLLDVTDYYTTIALSGPRAPDMLMKLSTLDLHPRAFGTGTVAGSMFGRAQATLWRLADDDQGVARFRLFVRWSMADYLWCLLAEAGREYGLPAQQPVSGETWRLER